MMAPVPQPEDERDKPGHHTDDNELDNTDYPDVIINAESSGSDEDDGEGEEEDDMAEGSAYLGYQSLSQNLQDSDSDENDQDDDDDDDDDDVDSDHHESGVIENSTSELHMPEGVLHQMRQADGSDPASIPGYMQVPDLPRPSKQELLWNQPASSDLSLDGGQMEKIKSVMAGIKLPSSNIPDWAKSLSDDQWQNQVVGRLVHKEPKHRHEHSVKSCDQSMKRRSGDCDDKDNTLNNSISATNNETVTEKAPD